MPTLVPTNPSLDEALAYCQKGTVARNSYSASSVWEAVAVARRARGDKAGAARAKANAKIKRDARAYDQRYSGARAYSWG